MMEMCFIRFSCWSNVLFFRISEFPVFYFTRLSLFSAFLFFSKYLENCFVLSDVCWEISEKLDCNSTLCPPEGSIATKAFVRITKNIYVLCLRLEVNCIWSLNWSLNNKLLLCSTKSTRRHGAAAVDNIQTCNRYIFQKKYFW